jgi:hypothetical protein
MSTNTLTTAGRPARTCSPAGRVTRSLLGYGVLAGPVYLVTSLAQALTRPGFDLTRHDWSLLANGPWGWIQSTNLIITGLTSLAFAIGLGRALAATGSGGDRAAGGGSAGRAAGGSGPDWAAGHRGARWAAVLAGAYGGGLVLAGIFRADPAHGFPVGTPAGPGSVSSGGCWPGWRRASRRRTAWWPCWSCRRPGCRPAPAPAAPRCCSSTRTAAAGTGC